MAVIMGLADFPPCASTTSTSGFFVRLQRMTLPGVWGGAAWLSARQGKARRESLLASASRLCTRTRPQGFTIDIFRKVEEDGLLGGKEALTLKAPVGGI